MRFALVVLVEERESAKGCAARRNNRNCSCRWNRRMIGMVGYSAYPSWDAGMLFAVLMVSDGIGWLVDCEELFFEALVMCVRVWESSAEAASHWPSPTPFDIRRAFLRFTLYIYYPQ